jgi:hypothetical protein
MTTLERHTSPREILVEVIWTWILAALILTAALVVVGGAFILQAPAVQIVLGVLLVATIAFFTRQYLNRAELNKDPRIRAARERRGF